MNEPTLPADRKLAGTPQAAGHGQWPRQPIGREGRRLAPALLLSLLIHALLMNLTFNGQGHWIPGFGLPWQERRIEVPDLRVALSPAQLTAAEPAVTPIAEPTPQERVERSVVRSSASTPFVARAPTPAQTAAAIEPVANPSAGSSPKTGAAIDAAPEPMPLRGDRPSDAASVTNPAPTVIAVTKSDEATWVVPATPPVPAPVIAATQSASTLETGMPSLPDDGDAARVRIDQTTRERAAEPAKPDPSARDEHRQVEKRDADRSQAARSETAQLEAARQAAARQDASREAAERQEATLQGAARVAAAQVEAARVEAARVESARVESAQVESAQVEAARVETARQEAARQEAARQEAARQEAARQEAARQEAARQEAARQEVARQEAARVDVAKEAAAKREATLRAIGRQLDEEAARREAAAARQLPSSSGTRRYRLFGRTDPNAELILYAEAWSRKIQQNMTFDMVREAAKQPHTDPIVTVAIRSDGSVESVTFVRSSGIAALDDAIRRVVHSQAPYQAYPPGLAREFDVIEIRRTWYFDVAIRLY
jgi:outer membrane biosynthesis protein TonB